MNGLLEINRILENRCDDYMVADFFYKLFSHNLLCDFTNNWGNAGPFKIILNSWEQVMPKSSLDIYNRFSGLIKMIKDECDIESSQDLIEPTIVYDVELAPKILLYSQIGSHFRKILESETYGYIEDDKEKLRTRCVDDIETYNINDNVIFFACIGAIDDLKRSMEPLIWDQISIPYKKKKLSHWFKKYQNNNFTIS